MIKNYSSWAAKYIRCYPALQLIQPEQDYSDEMRSSKEKLHLGVVISKNSRHCLWSWEAGAKWVVHVSAIPLCLIRCHSLIFCVSGNEPTVCSQHSLLLRREVPRKSADEITLQTQTTEECPRKWGMDEKPPQEENTALLCCHCHPSLLIVLQVKERWMSLLRVRKQSYHKYRKQFKIQERIAAVGQSKGPSVLVYPVSDSSHTSQKNIATWNSGSPLGHFSSWQWFKHVFSKPARGLHSHEQRVFSPFRFFPLHFELI